MKKIHSCLLLIIIILSISLAFTLKLCKNSETYALELKFNDYSRENSIESLKFNASEFLSLILDCDLSAEEKEYLDTYYNDIYLAYDNKIDSKLINTSLVDEELTIHASAYSYNTKDGFVTWIPYSVTFKESEALFSYNLETYECVINNFTAEAEEVNIKYKTNLNISKESINYVLNATYDVCDAYVTGNVYEVEHNKYLNDLEKYNTYLSDLEKYEEDLNKYNEYLVNKQIYDDKLSLYNEYLAEYQVYLEELSKYNEYLVLLEEYPSKVQAYQDYLNAVEEYNANFEEEVALYNAYLEKKAKVDYQLASMDLIKTSMTSLNRTIYNAVLGDTVTQVLSMKADLVQLQVDEAIIDRAEAATIYLRNYFTSYFALDGEEEKYVFYSSNYSKFKTNIEELLRCLDKLYRSGLVSEAIAYKESTEKYLILVAQLALVCNAIDNNPVYNYEAWNVTSKKGNMNMNGARIIDENWTITSKTYTELLENVIYVEDTTKDAYPLVGGYPEEVTLPGYPEEVEAPVSPTPVKEPIAPTEVSNPGDAPTVVIEPTIPTEVLEPTEYLTPDYITSILNVYKVSLFEREEFISDYELNLTSSFTKKVRNQEEVTVEFYDENEVFIKSYAVDNGSYIIYDCSLPSKEGDLVYSSYKFVGWAYEDGVALDLSNVTREGFVYPVFEGTLKDYIITFVIGDSEYKDVYHYGDTPICTYPLEKEASGGSYFEYVGFDKEIEAVTKDATYVSLFNALPILSDGESIASIEMDNGVIKVDAKDFEKCEFNLEKIYEYYVNISSSIQIETNFGNISINSYELNKLKNDNVNSIIVLVSGSDDDLLIKFDIDSDNQYNIGLTINGTFDSNHANLYLVNGDDEVKLRANITNESIYYSFSTLATYRFFESYQTNKLENANVNFSLSEKEAKKGEMVTISIDSIANGMKIDKIYVVDSNNEYLDLTKDGNNYTFYMVSDDVYVGFVTSYIDYVITFVSNDVVISSKTYHYGDTVLIPNDPILVSDEYVYTFVGWDKEVSETVTESVTYNALFEISENNEEIEKRKSIIKVVKIVAISFVLGSLVIAAGVILIVFFRKKK